LKSEEVQRKIGSLFEGISLKSRYTSGYPLIFIVRRLILVFVLVFG
jgi:hypothetical protein